jgi:hypothetical protein
VLCELRRGGILGGRGTSGPRGGHGADRGDGQRQRDGLAVEGVLAQHRRAEPDGLAQRDVEFRAGVAVLGDVEAGCGTQHSLSLGRRSGQDPGGVGQHEERQVEGPGPVDEPSGLVGRRGVDGAGLGRGLAGDDGDRRAIEPGQSGQQRPTPGGLQLEPGPAVDDRLDGPPPVVRRAPVGGDHGGQVGAGGCDRGPGGGPSTGAEWEVAEDRAQQREGLVLVGDHEVGHTGRGVNVGSAECLDVHLFTRGHRHDGGTGREQLAGALHHHHHVGQRRSERAVPGRGAEHADQQGNHPGTVGQRRQVGGRRSPTLERVRRPVTPTVEQHDQRHPLLAGQAGQALAFGGSGQADGAPAHAGILGAHQDRATVDHPVAGGERVGRCVLADAGQGADLPERVGVEQCRHPLAGVEATSVPTQGQPPWVAHGAGCGAASVELGVRLLPPLVDIHDPQSCRMVQTRDHGRHDPSRCPRRLGADDSGGRPRLRLPVGGRGRPTPLGRTSISTASWWPSTARDRGHLRFLRAGGHPAGSGLAPDGGHHLGVGGHHASPAGPAAPHDHRPAPRHRRTRRAAGVPVRLGGRHLRAVRIRHGQPAAPGHHRHPPDSIARRRACHGRAGPLRQR